MADPHNHTHQQRRHTRLGVRRGTRLATLAVLALTAALLTVTASPVAAGQQQPDARSTWLACVGPALASQGFSDVAMDSAHYNNINCLKYYGITTGRMGGTEYDPNSNVTRSQMALFLTRAASVAGIDLGDAMDMGFTDLDSTGADRVQAINVLAAKRIMPGRTATTFDPLALVTRVEMAQHLFTLLDLALDSIHIDTLPEPVDNDVTGIEVNVTNGDGMRPDDHFGDVRRTQPVHLADMINAIYELGVTNGTNSQVGDNGTFDPLGNVTRAQMASFIMRALGHTNLRPEGLTVQQTSDQTRISVRDKDFKPVPDRRVELISSNYPEDAFDRNGRCITSPSYVTGSIGGVNTSGFDPCRIDLGDARTDATGNAFFAVGSASGARFSVECTTTDDPPAGGGTFRFTGDPSAPATMWAWQGDMNSAVDSRSTDLVEPVGANADNPGRATRATIAGGSSNDVKMGRSLTYTIQLRSDGGKPVGPTPGANHDYDVTIVKRAEAQGTAASGAARSYTREVFRRTTTHSPDGSGLITIPVTNPDPTPYAATATAANDSDVQVSVTVVAVTGNTLPLVDQTGGAASDSRTAAGTAGTNPAGTVVRVDPPVGVFSDNASVESRLVAVSEPWRLRSNVNRNSISVEVFDQYGAPFGGNGNMIAPTTTPVADFQDSGGNAVKYTLPANGQRTITYTHTGTDANTQTVEIALHDSDGDPVPNLAAASVTVEWADRAAGTGTDTGTEVAVRVGDPRMNFIVVGNDGATPSAYQYGPDDTFSVEGAEVTLAQFEEVLASFGTKESDPISNRGKLTWARYDFNRPRDGATWSLSGLGCRPSAATR